jgi:predicted flap endonuclease-1-like 5' DNA nuclease
MRILGLDATARDVLLANGITRFSQVANWSPQDAQRFDGLIGAGGRVVRENWPAQAVALLQGGDPASVRNRATVPPVTEVAAPPPASPTAPPAPAAPVAAEPPSGDVVRPTRLAEAIRANQVKPAGEAGASSGPRSDIAGFRSVRSELLRGTPAGDPGRSDDLKRIRGIGVLIEKKLNSLGVTRYEQIANWTSNDIDRMSHMLDFKGRIERESWVEQARILATGGQTEFSRRLDKP